MMNLSMITASQLSSLLEILYVLVIDYIDNGPEHRPDKETAAELKLAEKSAKMWSKALPSLSVCIRAALDGTDKANLLAQLGNEIKGQFKNFRSNERFSIQELDVLNALGSYLRTDSPNALTKIQKFAGIVHSPYVSRRMVPEEGSQKETGDALRKLIYQMVGRDDTALTIEEAEQTRELHPDLYKQYLAYRRTHTKIWKDAIVAYVRRSGHELVPYQELLAYLEANGIDHMLPLGFTGQINDEGKLYTNKGQLIDGVPSPMQFPTVKMNPNYGKPNGGSAVFLAIRSDGTAGPYFYTVEYKKAAAREKFANVADLSDKMEGIRKRWLSDVKRFNDQQPICVASLVLEIMFQFSARVGTGNGNTGGQSTYGVSTLLVKHASVDASGNIVLRYLGKGAVKTVHKIMKSDPQQKILIQPLMQLMEGKSPKDRLFTVMRPNGKFFGVTPAQVNNAFHSFGAPSGVTVHKIRTYRGTKLFQQLIKQMVDSGKVPKNEKDAMTIYKKIGEQVGKLLNHVRTTSGGTKVTGSTALLNYIDSTVQIALWREWGFRPPKFLEKKFMNIE